MNTTRRAAYEQARQMAIDEVEELRGLVITSKSDPASRGIAAAKRDDRDRRIASLERQIIGLTTILETIR